MVAGAAEYGVDLRELLRAGDADLLLLLEDVLGGDAEVVVVGERGADEVLELGLVEDGGPLLVADGGFGVGGDSGVVGAAEGGRGGDDGAGVLGADVAAGRQEGEREKREHPANPRLRCETWGTQGCVGHRH